MAKWLSLSGIAAGSVGVFLGFYFYFGGASDTALAVVTVMTVGVVGLLAFVRHVFFFRSDMERLGWQTDRADWIFEVGFANLALAFAALLAVFARWGVEAQAVVVIAYALYLFQAAGLHAYRYVTSIEKSPARLWRSVVATALLAAMMMFFAIAALV